MASVSATSTAIIHVLDRNDNAPYFTQQLYKGEISESAPIASLILAVNETLHMDQRFVHAHTICFPPPPLFFAPRSIWGVERIICTWDNFHGGSPSVMQDTLSKIVQNATIGIRLTPGNKKETRKQYYMLTNPGRIVP